MNADERTELAIERRLREVADRRCGDLELALRRIMDACTAALDAPR